MNMSNNQIVTFSNHIAANQDPVIIEARTYATRNDKVVMDWYNSASVTDAWRYAMKGIDLWNAMVLTQYDGITQASKRELWMKWMDIANQVPVDFGRQENRNGLMDIWVSLNTSQMIAILQKCQEKALAVEMVFGPQTESTSSPTVSGVDRNNYRGACTIDEVSRALNLIPSANPPALVAEEEPNG